VAQRNFTSLFHSTCECTSKFLTISKRGKKEQGNGNISNYFLQELIYQSVVSCPWTGDCRRAKWLLFLPVPLEMHSSSSHLAWILWLMSTGITEMCLEPATVWLRGSWWKTVWDKAEEQRLWGSGDRRSRQKGGVEAETKESLPPSLPPSFKLWWLWWSSSDSLFDT